MGDCKKLGNCEDSRLEKIYYYMDGALSEAEIEIVRKHLEECEDCANECNVETIIRDALKRSCCEKAPDSLKSKLAKFEV
ncbi:MAG: mycothiol system anti-sigma-R factor [Micrococcaceae bacterium]